MAKLLLIDDDVQLTGLLKEYFQRFEFSLDSATHPDKGLSMLASDNYDLVILDIMLPGMDGFEVCKLIRKDNEIPIVMLTARGEVMDRIVGMELGADDYLPKPFEPRELVVRIQSILKRYSKSPSKNTSLRFDRIEIDTNLRRVEIDGNELSLSSMEYRLLEILARSPGKVFDRDEILNLVKGIDADVYSRSVDILVSRLRQKLKPMEAIKTIRGRGYVFTGSPS